jgi:hypothetical protein
MKLKINIEIILIHFFIELLFKYELSYLRNTNKLK